MPAASASTTTCCPLLLDVARRRRDHGHAHDGRLFDARQWRTPHQADPDRPHPGPLGQDDLPARRSRAASAATPRHWTARTSPKLVDNREQVLDPLTAYQMTSILEGVVQRGTAPVDQDPSASRSPARPAPPTTPRTSGSSASRRTSRSGVYPRLRQAALARRLGARPASTRRPIFRDFMTDGAEGQAGDPVPRPAGHQADPRERLDAAPARRRRGEGGGVILEAFKPGTAPPDSYQPPSDSGGRGESGYAGRAGPGASARERGGLY